MVDETAAMLAAQELCFAFAAKKADGDDTVTIGRESGKCVDPVKCVTHAISSSVVRPAVSIRSAGLNTSYSTRIENLPTVTVPEAFLNSLKTV